MIDVARAGDFATFEDRDSARLAFALAAYDDPERSPLPAEVFRTAYAERCGRLYEEVVPRFTELLDDMGEPPAVGGGGRAPRREPRCDPERRGRVA